MSSTLGAFLDTVFTLQELLSLSEYELVQLGEIGGNLTLKAEWWRRHRRRRRQT